MDPLTITVDEVARRMDARESVFFVDARSAHAWDKAETIIPHALRVPPDDVVSRAADIPRDALIVAYCTCPHEESSLKVARTLTERGWTNVRALVGGLDAWQRAGRPLEAKPTRRQSPEEVSENIAKAEGEEVGLPD